MRRRAALGLVKLVGVLAVIGLVLIGAWLGVMRWMRPGVSVTNIVERRVVQAFYATGTLQPVREYPIRSNNPGALIEVRVDKGDKLRRDQPLAVVREDSVEFRYDQAKADRDMKAKLADEEKSPVLKEFDARAAAARRLASLPPERLGRRLQHHR